MSPTGTTLALWRRLAASDFVQKVLETYATQVLRIILGLATTVIIARILGPEGRGLYGVAVAIGFLGTQFGNLGFHASNTYFVARNRNLLPGLLGNTLTLSFVGGSVCAAGALFAFLRWPKLAPLNGSLLLIALASIPLGLAYLLLQNLLLGIQAVRAYNMIELANRVLSVGLVASLIAMRLVRVETVLLASLAALVLCSGGMLWQLGGLLERIPWPSLALFRDTLGVGFRAYLVCLFSFLVLRVDLLMVKYMLGAEQAGYYSVAATMADYISMFAVVVGTILFPKLAALPDSREKLRLAKHAALATSVVLLPLVVVPAVLAKLIVHLMFGHAFLPAASALIWLMPGIFFLGVETVIVQYLNSLGYPISVVALWGVSTLLNIGLNLWAIPNYGIVGASAVSSVSYFLMFISVLWIVRRGKRAEPAVIEMPVSYVP